MSQGEWWLAGALAFTVWLTLDLVALLWVAAAIAIAAAACFGVLCLMGLT